jgi:hypothetical protein
MINLKINDYSTYETLNFTSILNDLSMQISNASICDDNFSADFIKRPILKVRTLNLSTFEKLDFSDNEKVENVLKSYLAVLASFDWQD